jgi:hypothetical protein
VGEEIDQALREIDATRSQLERDIDELFARLPDREVVTRQAKTYGAAAIGTAAVVGLGGAQMKRRSEVKERRETARINAEELARAFSPHPVEPARSGGRMGLLAVLVAVAAMVAAFLQARRHDG